MRKRMIDWGAYLGWNGSIVLPWKDLIEKGKVEAFSCKGDQEDIPNGYSTVLNLKASRDSGIKANGTYYWHNPSLNKVYLLEQYCRAIDRENPDFIHVDIEQWETYSGSGEKVNPAIISDTAYYLCNGLRTRYPQLWKGIYTRQNFPIQYSPQMSQWLPDFDFGWTASWNDWGLKTYRMSWEDIANNKMQGYPNGAIISTEYLEPANILDWTDWDIWQYSSRILLPAEYYGTIYDHQYDWCVLNEKYESFEKWLNREVITNPMTTLYNTSVAQKDRAVVFTLEPGQKLTVAPASLKIDAVRLKMGGMDYWDGSHMQVHEDDTFAGRFDLFNNAGIPVIGTFALDAGFWLKEQHIASEPEGQSLRDNFVLKELIDGWHIGNWTWDSVLAKQGKFRNIVAIELSMVGTEGFNGAMVSDDWQARTFRHVANHLKLMQTNGQLPNVPVILYTGPWFFETYKYNGIFAQEVRNRNSWLYLNLGQYTLQSTATFNSLAEIYAFRPADTFAFSSYPETYFDRILMHEYTGPREVSVGNMDGQKVVYVTDKNGKATPITLALWNDTKDAMYKFLNFSGSVVVPPVEPPVEPPVTGEIETRLTTAEAKISALESNLTVVVNKYSDLNTKLENLLTKLRSV